MRILNAKHPYIGATQCCSWLTWSTTKYNYVHGVQLSTTMYMEHN